MKLGDFLSGSNSSRQLAPTKLVKFAVVGEDRQSGAKVQAEADALLVFVDEGKRSEALRKADKTLRIDYPDGNAPPVLLFNEEVIQLLALALRDADNARQPFAQSADELRNALVMPEARRLYAEYTKWVADEFPDNPTAEQFEGLVNEAEKK